LIDQLEISMALTRGFLASTVLHGCAHLVQPHATREAEPTLEPAAAAALHESSSSYCGGASAHGDAECEGLHWHAQARRQRYTLPREVAAVGMEEARCGRHVERVEVLLL
jgi:hypothetical protein